METTVFHYIIETEVCLLAIPLYFAANWKQFVYSPGKRWAQTGFGVTTGGALRLPQERIPDALCVIDDREVPADPVSDELLQALAEQCRSGCFLDFERPPLPFHAALLAALAQVTPLLVAQRFASGPVQALAVISCPQPCNSWAHFCRERAARWPGGWALEVTPWQHSVRSQLRCAAMPRFLPGALCRCRSGADGPVYYDDRETLLQKLAVAERYGCRAAIGLAEELAAAGLT